MEKKFIKPTKNHKKLEPNQKYGIFYFILFICIILIEIFLIVKSGEKYKEYKKSFKSKHNLILNLNSNISNLLKEIETNEKEIKIIENDTIPNNNIILQSYEKKQNILINESNELSQAFHKSFEEYESRKEIYDDEIIEKNNTIKELYIELKNNILLRTNLEDKLDNIEEHLTEDLSNINIKSSILENDESKKNLLIKWITGTGEGQIKKIKLIFSAEEYDFDSFSFHEICGNEDIDNTLIIIKTENDDIIGGFTFASWRPNSLISYDDKAFLFNLNKEFKIRVSSPSWAINSRINDGPIFGMYDLIINLDKIKVQEKLESYGDKDLEIGSDVVRIINYEVFTVIFK